MSNPFPKLLVIAAVMVSLMIAISPARAVRYSVTDVDQTDLYTSTQAYKINDSGQISGTGYLSTGENHVFQWDLVGLFSDLGSFAQTGQNAEGRNINSSGVVAGFQQLASGIYQALRWNVGNTGNSVDVFTALGGAGLESKAYGIGVTDVNGFGNVVGSSVTAGGPVHATKWYGAAGSGSFTATDLDTIAGDSASTAYAVNDAGDATGEVTLASDETHAFLYTGGKMKDLGCLTDGHWSAGYDIAQDGTVVGQSETTGGLLHAFISNASGLVDLGPVYDSTGTAVTGNTSALGINTVTGVGQVVVGTADDASGNTQAAVWINGKGSFLADMINDNPGWTLSQATGVNASGQIVGYGLLSTAISQQSRAFRLDPVTPDIKAINLDPQGDTTLSVEGGTTLTATVVLTDYAPSPDGVNVVIPPDALNQSLYSIVYDGKDAGVNGAGYIHVPAGSNTANFTIQTDPVASDTPITLQGSIDHKGATDPWAAATANPQSTLTLTSPSVASFTIEDVNKNVIETANSGDTIYFHVTLSQKAPDDKQDLANPGFHVPVASTNTAVNAPVSVFVPLGDTEVWQSVPTNSVNVVTTGDITLTLGAQVLDLPITVNPPQNLSITIVNTNANDTAPQAPSTDPGASATGGAETRQPTTPSLLLGITLKGAAPAAGQDVTITTDDPSASVPDQTIIDPATGQPSCIVTSGVATIQAGYSGASVEIDTIPVITDTPVHFTASMTTDQTYQESYTLWVDVPTLVSFTIAPAPATAVGYSYIGTVTLSGPAADGLEIDAASYNPAATLVDQTTLLPITTVPITAGNTSQTFGIATTQVSTDSSGLISVSLGDDTLTQPLIVTAPTIQSFVLQDANGNNITTVMGGKAQVFGVVTLSQPAPAGGLTVTLTGDANAQANAQVNTANDNNAVNNQSLGTPISITIPEGVQTQLFTIETSALYSNASDVFSVAIQGAEEQTSATLQVLAPTISSVTLDQTVVSGVTVVGGKVTLTGPVPAGSTYTVDLSTSAPNTVSLSSPTLVINANDANNNGYGTFTVTTKTVAKDIVVTISAKTPDVNSPTTPASTRTAQLTVQAPGIKDIYLNGLAAKDTVGGGATVPNCYVKMNTAASTNTVVTLTSSNPAVATLPKTITVLAGNDSNQLSPFTITTYAVSTDTNVVITATAGNKTISQTLLVTAPVISSVTPLNWTLVGGNSGVGTITLSAPAAIGGLPVTMTSDFPNVVIPPASLSIPYGRTTYPFNINTQPVATQTIVTLNLVVNGVTFPVSVTVNPPSVKSFTLTPSHAPSATVPGTAAVQATITLDGTAPAGNQSITLTASAVDSNGNSVTSPVKIPTISVLAGQNVVTVSIPTIAVANDTTVTLSASTTANINPVQATLNVLKPKPLAIVLSKSSVVGGQSITGILTLTGPAPTGGLSFQLTSTNAAVTVPAAVNVAPGATSAQITPISTVAVATAVNGNISATGTTVSTPITVTPPTIQSVKIYQDQLMTIPVTSVPGSTNAYAFVTLSGAAPAGWSVTLVSNDPSVTVVGSPTFAPNASVSNAVQILTVPVTANKTVTLAASKNNQMASTTLTVTPPALSAIAFTPAQITGGQIGANSTNVKITLTAPAPAGGLKVSLVADNGTVISGLPTSITVPGNLGVTPYTYTYPVSVFAINSVAKDTAVTVTAVVNGVSKQATLTVMAPSITSLTPMAANLPYPYKDKAGTIQSMGAYPDANGYPSMYGGGTVNMKVNLTNSAPSSLTLNLKSANLDSTLPNAATVAASTPAVVGQQVTPFPLTTLPVAVDTAVSVSVWTNSTINASPTSVIIWVLAPTFASAQNPAVANYLNLTGFGLTCTDTLGNSTVGLGTNVVGVINLNSPAPAGGLKVQLTSDATCVTVPSFVMVPANQTHATFVIKTTAVNLGGTTITATINSKNPIPQTATQTLMITNPTVSAISFAQSSIPGGDPSGVLNTTTGTVTLSANAVDEGAGGQDVVLDILDNTGVDSTNLLFANSAAKTTVLVPTGTKTATFEVDATTGVSQNTVFTVTAAANGQTTPVTKIITVTPATPESLDITAADGSATIEGGENATGIANLNVPSYLGENLLLFVANTKLITLCEADASGAPILDANNNPIPLTADKKAGAGYFDLPVTAGSQSVPFAIYAKSVASTTPVSITVTGQNKVAITSSVTVNPPSLSSISTYAAGGLVDGGNTVVVEVALDNPAPAAGVSVALSTDNASFYYVPIPAAALKLTPKQIAAQPHITSVTLTSANTNNTADVYLVTVPEANITTVTLSGKLLGVTKTTSVQVNPPALDSITADKSTVKGGQPINFTVKLSAPAPNGFTYYLNSSDNTVISPLATPYKFTQGQMTNTVQLSAVPQANTATVTLTATSSDKSFTTAPVSITVNAPDVKLLTIPVTSANGGTTISGSVTLDYPAPNGGTIVNFSGCSISSPVQVSGTVDHVTVLKNATTANFTLITSPEAATTYVNIVANTVNGSTPKAITITLRPPTLSTFSFDKTVGTLLTTFTGTVTLSGPAADDGSDPLNPGMNLTVTTTSGVVTPTSQVYRIPAGATSYKLVKLYGGTVTKITSVTATAQLGTGTKLSKTLTVTP